MLFELKVVFLLCLVDIVLTFFDSSFNLFLFDVTFFTWLPKSALFTKLAISLCLAKFARFNLKSKLYFSKLLNSGVVIYLSCLGSVSVLTKLQTLATVRALVVTRFVILGILSLTLFILALRKAFVAIS